jgi:hypothetical protein
MILNKLATIINRIKTPLSLAGLTILVLYQLYSQALSLPIYENIGADPTFRLLQNLLDKVFWLSLLALLLGVASYITALVISRRSPPLESDVALIAADHDPQESPGYEQHRAGRRKRIVPKRPAS